MLCISTSHRLTYKATLRAYGEQAPPLLDAAQSLQDLVGLGLSWRSRKTECQREATEAQARGSSGEVNSQGNPFKTVDYTHTTLQCFGPMMEGALVVSGKTVWSFPAGWLGE